MYYFDILTHLLWMTRLVSCFPLSNSDGLILPDEQSLSDVTWTGTITAGGPIVTLTSQSIGELQTKIRAIEPAFEWSSAPQESYDYAPLRARNEDRLICNNVTYGNANSDEITQQVADIQKMPGLCRVSPTPTDGPLNCNRITCSGNSYVSRRLPRAYSFVTTILITMRSRSAPESASMRSRSFRGVQKGLQCKARYMTQIIGA
ncbi:hypothetical protein F5Y18DRAFT_432931 [Xylariaceae sp. FL1019]|nr:hypothetical protein F5Y18DRAFT_432931 [Xylariaceae sp. FL1019]